MATRNEQDFNRPSGIRGRSAQAALGILTTLLLAVSLVGSGLFMCCAPFTTSALSNAFSRWEGSPFTKEELVESALATQDYTVGGHSRDEVIHAIYHINLSAQADGRTTAPGAPDLPDESANPATDELATRFMLAGETYVLTDDALSHLDDVYYVIDAARIALMVIAALALSGCIAIGLTGGRRHLGRVLIFASTLIFALFVTLALWIIIDFNGFFTLLHSLFFAEGTWTFSADSLLIRMYPTNFWIGMGVVWLVTTVLACLICSILGFSVKGKRKV